MDQSGCSCFVSVMRTESSFFEVKNDRLIEIMTKSMILFFTPPLMRWISFVFGKAILHVMKFYKAGLCVA